jgi:hypothetical protein
MDIRRKFTLSDHYNLVGPIIIISKKLIFRFIEKLIYLVYIIDKEKNVNAPTM